MKTHYISFGERQERSKYIARTFSKYLNNSLLDVGCDKAVLRDLLPIDDYLGIDFGGTPDLELNLEKIDRIPLDDNQYSTCVCSDVLEHLDNLHYVFSELVRVTNKYLIISLPNNWCNARRPIERGKGEMAHYGLPTERPKDRHKWFFGFTEARKFLEAQVAKYPLKIVDVIANDKPRNKIVRIVRKLRYPGERYLNRYAHTVWVVYEINQDT